MTADKGAGHRYLVVARAGDHSLHSEWIHPKEFRNFDLALSYYGDQAGRYREDCQYYFQAKGTKWPKIYDLIKKLGDRIFQYEAIWFPDDDLRTHPGNISRMFELFTEQRLLLAQPALTGNSYFQVTAQHIDYKLRYTHFVEIMAPVFSREALRSCWHTFNKSVTGWGMEHVWAKLLGYPHKGMAILDETPVKHTRPPGQGDLYDNIKNHLKIDIWDPKYQNVWKEYDIDVPESADITYYDGIKAWDPYLAFTETRQEAPIQQKQGTGGARRAKRLTAVRRKAGGRVKRVKATKSARSGKSVKASRSLMKPFIKRSASPSLIRKRRKPTFTRTAARKTNPLKRKGG